MPDIKMPEIKSRPQRRRGQGGQGHRRRGQGRHLRGDRRRRARLPAGPGPAPGAAQAAGRTRRPTCGPGGRVRTDLSGALQDVDTTVDDLVDRLEEIIERMEAAVAPFEDRLPPQARDMAKQAHVQAKEARSQIRSRIPSMAGTTARSADSPRTRVSPAAPASRRARRRGSRSSGISGFHPVAATSRAGSPRSTGTSTGRTSAGIGLELERGAGQLEQAVGDLPDRDVPPGSRRCTRRPAARLDQQPVGPHHVADVGEVTPGRQIADRDGRCAPAARPPRCAWPAPPPRSWASGPGRCG